MITTNKIILFNLSVMTLMHILFFYNYKTEIYGNMSMMYKNYYRTNFDYFVLSLTYPTTYCLDRLHCTDEQFKNVNVNFNLHGLWANNFDGTYPEHCSDIPFDKKYIDEHKEDFMKYMSTFNNELEYSFYEHEWTKHGTCSNSSKINDENTYFENAINLTKGYDILECLRQYNIVPSNTTRYDKNTLKKAISKCYPKISFNLQCDGYKLSEIHIYYDKNLEPLNVDYGDKCANNILIP